MSLDDRAPDREPMPNTSSLGRELKTTRRRSRHKRPSRHWDPRPEPFLAPGWLPYVEIKRQSSRPGERDQPRALDCCKASQHHHTAAAFSGDDDGLLEFQPFRDRDRVIRYDAVIRLGSCRETIRCSLFGPPQTHAAREYSVGDQVPSSIKVNDDGFPNRPYAILILDGAICRRDRPRRVVEVIR
jgi:hypothetical protein